MTISPATVNIPLTLCDGSWPFEYAAAAVHLIYPVPMGGHYLLHASYISPPNKNS